MPSIEQNEKDIEEIKGQLLSLQSENKSKLRFFFQYLLAPILVLGFGFSFNLLLENKKSEMKQFELANAMLPKVFSEDIYVSLATQKILDSVLQDKGLKTAIQELVTKQFEEKLRSVSNDPQDTKADEVIRVAKSFNSSITSDLTKYQKALKLEKVGFESLIKKNYKGAIQAFDQAEEIYPSFHQTHEITNLLKTNESTLNNNETRKKVLNIIVDNMAWKAPQKQINELKSELGKDN